MFTNYPAPADANARDYERYESDGEEDDWLRTIDKSTRSRSRVRRFWKAFAFLYFTIFVLAPVAIFGYDMFSDQDTMEEPIPQILTIYAIAFNIVSVFLFVGMYRRRHLHPFRARCFPLILVAALGACFLSNYLCLRPFKYTSAITCVGSIILTHLVYPCTFLPYLLRGYRLYHIFLVSGTRKLLTNCRMMCLFLVLMLPYIATAVVAVLYGEFNLMGDLDEECMEEDVMTSLPYWLSVRWLEIVAFTCMIYKISAEQVWDEFNIRSELVVLFLIQVVGVVIRTVELATGGRLENYPAVYMLLVRCAVIMFVSVAWPLHKTYILDPLVNTPLLLAERSKSKALTLSSILRDPTSFRYFDQFVQSYENGRYSYLLLFHVEVELLRDLPPEARGRRWGAARELFRTFVRFPGFFACVEPELVYTLSEYAGGRVDPVAEGTVLAVDVFDSTQESVVAALEETLLLPFFESGECAELETFEQQSQDIKQYLLGASMIKPTELRSTPPLRSPSDLDSPVSPCSSALGGPLPQAPSRRTSRRSSTSIPPAP